MWKFLHFKRMNCIYGLRQDHRLADQKERIIFQRTSTGESFWEKLLLLSFSWGRDTLMYHRWIWDQTKFRFVIIDRDSYYRSRRTRSLNHQDPVIFERILKNTNRLKYQINHWKKWHSMNIEKNEKYFDISSWFDSFCSKLANININVFNDKYTLTWSFHFFILR